MPLTKAFLLELGVESGAATAIMSEHGKMQTTYLQQIDALQKQVADDENAHVKALSEAELAKEQALALVEATKAEWQAKFDSQALASKLTEALKDHKAFDNDLVTSLLKVDDLKLSSKDFDAKLQERVEKLVEERPYLFEKTDGDKPEEKQPEGEQGGERKGFNPAGKPTNEPQTVTYSRVGRESYPDISTIMTF